MGDTSEYIKECAKINANDLYEITLTFDGNGKGTYTSNLNYYFDLEPYHSEIDKISNYKNLIENTIIEVAFTDEYYGFFISKFNAEHMVKAYKIIHGTKRNADWSVADIMVNCLDIQEVNFEAYSEIFLNFINDLERFECDGFIIQVTKDKAEKINEDELIATCKTHYGFYLPTDFDYKNNIVLFRGRYSV